MEEMTANYKSIYSEIQDLKKQLAEHGDNSGLGSQAVKGLEKTADEMKEHCAGFRKNIFQKAADVIHNFAARGKIALYDITQKLGVKKSLMKDHDFYIQKAQKMQAAINRFDAIGNELDAAMKHITNVNSLAEGIHGSAKYQKLAGDAQKTLRKTIGRADRLDRLRAPYVRSLEKYTRLADRAEKKIGRLEALEKEAAQARSTLGKLSGYKKEASAQEAEKREQGRENTRKEPEMAL